MADNIRPFRGRAPEPTAEEERQLQRQIRKHRIQSRAAVLVFLLAALLLIVYFYIDYQVITPLVKTQKNGPQKSLRAKVCDLRVKSLYLRAEIKIERTKKKGEKLASCSLDIYLYLIINPFLPISFI